MISIQKVDGTTEQIGGRQVNQSSVINVAMVAAYQVPMDEVQAQVAIIRKNMVGQDHVAIRDMVAHASHEIYTPNTATGHEIRQKIRKVIRAVVPC